MARPDARRPAVRVLHSLLGLLWFSLWFFVALPAAVLWSTGAAWQPDGGVASALGAGLVAVAYAAVIAECLRFALRGQGTPMPFDPPRVLVAEGPYRFVRNPMYTLYLAVVIGEALAYRSAGLALYACVFAGLVHLYVVKREEPRLRERFGEAYDAYRERVPRWLPRRTLPDEVRSSDATTRNSRGTL